MLLGGPKTRLRFIMFTIIIMSLFWHFHLLLDLKKTTGRGSNSGANLTQVINTSFIFSNPLKLICFNDRAGIGFKILSFKMITCEVQY